MCAAVYKDILNTSIGEELKSVFDQGGICERKKTLIGTLAMDWTVANGRAESRTLGRSRVNGANFLSYESARTCLTIVMTRIGRFLNVTNVQRPVEYLLVVPLSTSAL